LDDQKYPVLKFDVQNQTEAWVGWSKMLFPFFITRSISNWVVQYWYEQQGQIQSMAIQSQYSHANETMRAACAIILDGCYRRGHPLRKKYPEEIHHEYRSVRPMLESPETPNHWATHIDLWTMYKCWILRSEEGRSGFSWAVGVLTANAVSVDW
jgi:hypothetical protein